MPLNNQEKLALSDFLNKMDETTLCRLGASVTNGTINPKSREDAFNCVMLHTDSLYQLLNLKRVNTGVLLRYLHHLNEPVPGTATKEEMLQRLYQKWNLPLPFKTVNYPSPVMPVGNSYLPGNNSCMPVSNQYVPVNNSCMPATNSYGLASNMYPPAINSSLPQNHQFQMMVEASRTFNVGVNYDPLSQMVRSKEVLKEMNSMAFNEYIVSFAQTFYDLLNTPKEPWLHGFNDTHFFGECKLKVMIKGASEDIEHEGEGINQVLSVLSDLKQEHQIYFSPNLTEQGVRSKQDSHGLVSAAVCGTLHQRSGPVGVFEQCFILSSDPFAKETYKIMETVLILRSNNAVSSMTEYMLTGKKNNDSLTIETKPRLAIADSQ